ncbi:hypothetical protein B0F90DRAFT_1783501 [Multifurca ochricompacta]|uniref:Uncharacterized protein n=1 Tax=Multifurca ochricompacta TaxID=376703 RepID=A0AAD4LU64_9AGAM|nr:hypothetical protein B0F90DRAFT_1783501 [Multifurca ochricompacta]
MKANVFRVLRKQGTSALVLSSRPPWSLRLSLPFPHPTFSSHDRLGAFFPFRHFSFTHALKLDDRPSQTTFEDPSRRGLFYHLVPPPTPLSDTRPVFAVSFLADPPPFSESTTILGWLPAETPGDDHEAGLNDFMENSRFLPLLHEAISQGLAEAVDDIQAAGALQLGEGWMHVHDDRNVPPLNRIGDPDDILASVRVEGGKILAETYQAMPSYRICTTHGITQLTEGLVLKLRRS